MARFSQQAWREFRALRESNLKTVRAWAPDGKQYIAILSGVGGWSGIGIAVGLGGEDPTAGLGALGAFADVAEYSNLGGVLTVFSLP